VGRKVHPVGQRLKINKEWKSKWFSDKNYKANLLEDFALRKGIIDKLKKTAGICEVEIKRSAHQIEIAVFTSRPGVIIGRGGAGIDDLRKSIEKITKDKLNLQIMEIKNPYLSAPTVFTQIAEQIEKRVAYRRAVKKAIEQVMKAGALGVKVSVGGRLNGADISRSETFIEGTVPLSTFKADIDYYSAPARTTYGAIGVKVWIFKKEESVSN
jgi:small subunit ribosomal protein S3